MERKIVAIATFEVDEVELLVEKHKDSNSTYKQKRGSKNLLPLTKPNNSRTKGENNYYFSNQLKKVFFICSLSFIYKPIRTPKPLE